jgi:hypothetical protein
MVNYGMNALLAGLIGAAATLIGSFTTYVFQGRNADSPGI